MDKIQLNFTLSIYIIIPILLLSFLTVWYLYTSTTPSLIFRNKIILVIFRFLIIALLLFLIAEPLISYLYSEKKKKQIWVLYDQSNSTKKYHKQYETALDKIKSIAIENATENNIITFNKNENSTDILTEINKLNSSKSPVIILSDGNQNTNTRQKRNYDFPILSFPIGIKPPEDFFEILKIDLPNKIQKRSDINMIPILISVSNISQTEKRFIVLLNDSIIFRKKLTLPTGKHIIQVPLNTLTKDSIFSIHVELKSSKESKNKEKIVRIVPNPTKITYVFFRPNLNARAIIQSLQNKDEFTFHYINTNTLLDLTKIQTKLLIISDLADFNDYQKNIVYSKLRKENIPFFLIGKIPNNLDALDLNLSKLQKRKSSKLIFSSKLPYFLSSEMKAKEYINLSSLPKINYTTLQLKSLKRETIESVFNYKIGFLYLIGNRFKKRLALINSDEFWKLKSLLTRNLQYQYFFEDLVYRITQLLLQNIKSLIHVKIDPKTLIAEQRLPLKIRIMDQNNTPIKFDFLSIKSFDSAKKLIESAEIPYHTSGQYRSRIMLAKDSLVNLSFETILSSNRQLYKTTIYRLQKEIQETKDVYINQYFFESIGAKQLKSLDSLNTILRNNEEQIIIKNKLLKPINYSFLLYFILFLLVIEWVLRKQFKLM